jgi:hypothetical protein
MLYLSKKNKKSTYRDLYLVKFNCFLFLYNATSKRNINSENSSFFQIFIFKFKNSNYHVNLYLLISEKELSFDSYLIFSKVLFSFNCSVYF